MLGFIGAGNMGRAILEGAIRSGAVAADQAIVYDADADCAGRVRAELGVAAADSLGQLARKCDMLLLAVKPNVVGSVLSGLDLHGKALISIAAGWSHDMLCAAAPGSRVLRVMPNTPALVGAGAAAFSRAHTLAAGEAAFVKRLFESIGRVFWVEEYQMEAAVGVLGSGPAYAFLFVEAMADGGVLEGLPRAVALEMAAQTLLGAAKLALEDGRHPGALKDMVCSPGGTTIEA
ncbi:MAG: pyrroline-5-carboxylate reductase, partial [Clostridiales bacterium]|nr:pyrroline-5-carboxylate reductase [Clostridiales bacterium]